MAIPLRVLIVEDSEDDAILILRQLRKGGFDPQWERVETPEALAEALEREDWDIILSDYKMPRFDGSAALEVLNTKGKDIPFIVISGVLIEESAVELLKAGANDFVKKGNWSRLIPAINREVREAQGREEKRLAQRARKEAEARYTNLFENAVEGIFQCTPQGRFVTVNPAMATILGYDTPQRLQRDLTDMGNELFVHKSDYRTMLRELEGRGNVSGFEALVKRRNGGEIWVSLHARGITGDSGDLERIEGFLVDVSERKQAEEGLKRAEEKYRGIFENAVEGIFQTTPDGRFVSANPAMARILGYESSKDLMSSITDIKFQMYADPKERDAFIELIRKNKVVNGFEAQYLRKDGSTIWASLHARPVYDEQGNLAYMEGTFQDISARKKAEQDRARLEEQLRHSQKMEAIGILAGGVAHDFNNLLQAISGHVQLLLMQKGEDDKDCKYLNVINHTVSRATELIRQLLTFSRKTEPSFRLVELNQVVTGVVGLLRRAIPKMVQLEMRLGPGELGLCADPVQLEQVIMNLVNNSCDAMPEGGTIVIATETITLGEESSSRYLDLEPGKYLVVSVSDTGVGMDEETRKHIFEPFFTTKKLGAGTGIGLSSVYGIVRAHNGSVHCYSRPGQGTTFKIYLPAGTERCAALACEPPDTKRTRQGSETVLVVDDEQAILDMAKESMEHFGYKVRTAGSGEEALLIFERDHQDISLVVLDLGMPGMGGEQCLEKLRKLKPTLKVILASGYGAHKMAESPEDFGAVAFVSKPYRIEEMLETIRRVLDNNEE